MKNKIIGISILVVIIAAALGIYYMQGGGVQQVKLKGLIGGEKSGVLEDKEVIKLLKSRYGITLDYSVAGSIEMVREDEGDNDFLFPSSQIALEIFKQTKGQKLVKSQNIFNSPIVFYSWDNVTEALIKQGIVQKRNDSYYIVDLPKLVDLVSSGKKWSDIGLGELFGNINVISTDPTKSNSGNMFFALLSGIINNETVVDETTVDKVTPRLKQFYNRLGYLEDSSSKLFDQYLRTGAGAKPLIVGYENQIVEFAVQDQEQWNKVKNRVRILYPEPTVWSSHPVIALNSKASVLIKALEDKDIQKIAWERHGFRTGFAGVDSNAKILQIVGIPERIDKVMPIPNPNVMDKIIAALQAK